MTYILELWQTWVLRTSLAALAVILLFVSAYALLAPLLMELRRWFKQDTIGKFISAIVVFGFILYGGSKQAQTWRITFDGGIKQGASPSVVTNNSVSIYWQRDLTGGTYVPESATVYIDYRPNTESNAEWTVLAESYVGAWSWSGTVANATNYDYNVWAYYIPPAPVHTNGVWTYKTMRDRTERYAIPLRARVEVNGKAIATPKEKRKDEQD